MSHLHDSRQQSYRSPGQRLTTTLSWEGITIDAIGGSVVVILAVREGFEAWKGHLDGD